MEVSVKLHIGFLVMAATSVACMTPAWQPRLVHQASYDHGCPEEQVRLLRDSGDVLSRTVDLEVCGKDKRYRDIGGNRSTVWVDVTHGVPALAPATAP
jgi:hypothetical protein